MLRDTEDNVHSVEQGNMQDGEMYVCVVMRNFAG